MIGKILGNRYRVLRELGSGGMAWVYLAEDNKENQLVAIKILYPQFCEDLSYIQRFNREAKLASTLTDPHIVRVLDYGSDRDVHYLVMEYVEGQDLREALNYEGRFPWKDALEIIDQLAAALEHAHLHGVVHRDIKPQNVMLDQDGLLKVLDFGIARVPTLPSLTQSGFIGSPYYVSPEQAMGEEVDVRSDIYSTGIVLYELLSGKIPFDAKSPWSIISQHIANEPPPIELDKENIPAGVQSLLGRMVAKRPEDRFQTPSMLRRAIAAVLGGQPIPETGMETHPFEPIDRTGMADSLYQRSIEAIETEEWARAVDLLEQALKFDPDHAGAAERLPLAQEKARLAMLYNAARRAVQGELWNDAITNLNSILEVEPDYEDIEQLLEEARQGLKKEDVQKFVAARYKEGLAYFEAARWENAVGAFEDVTQVSPDYEQVKQLLAEAERRANPTLINRIRGALGGSDSAGAWARWALVTVGILVIIGLIFFGFGNRNPSVAEDDAQQRLKNLYEQAQQAITVGNTDRAVDLLDQILAENPDYADAATLKRELIEPTPPEDDLLADKLREVQNKVEAAQWTEAIDLLGQVRAADPEYEEARVASLFCDAYVGRGLEALSQIESQETEKEVIREALLDFEAGVSECPRRTDLQDQANRATAYLEALGVPAGEYETLIQLLTPIVAADAGYANNNARLMLYQAYLGRGQARQEASQIVGALSDYEAALALNVDDPSVAQRRRAGLLLAFGQSTPETPPVEETAEATNNTDPPSEEEPTPDPASEESPVAIIYEAPVLVAPEQDAIFPGRFAEVFLEWEPVGELAPDEYYDLTVMHIFADQPSYWGIATKETRVQLTEDIGVGRAGEDKFYWWVTVRKEGTASTAQGLDLPLSPQSEGRTFIWTP